ncbi:Adaptor complexes medium subunit family protein [Tritrichomonas foetus]|uniref:Adaptor complexes medium subunit family protein n=1 Tax=Tritrichomonas foetus TaxID=1144522 RepID=A0A1J4KS37_9EUKA|nr:Adaptor complexes medium subunit family protein [Tritrichomonas foetus]|eukprot:OHT13914.1 Adaptor complexes medium subunit family protein [Tritrichomonas foetus]
MIEKFKKPIKKWIFFGNCEKKGKINYPYSPSPMISAVAIIDRTGDILAIRRYRKDLSMSALDNFRIGVIAAKEADAPACIVDETSFLHYLENEIYYVAVTRQNANAGVIFEFLSRLPRVIRQILNIKGPLNVSTIKTEAPEIIELLDEMVDSGYPQNTDPESLRLLTQRQSQSSQQIPDSQVTIMATGAISWRAPKIKYKRNEIFVDVIEKVSLLVSAAGKILDASVNGNIMMKVYLSGMPECKIGFNDKVSIESENRQGISAVRTGVSIEVDDMVFHQCVKLTNFANDRAISFTPPDGEFELMRYRKTENIGVPFTITPMVHDLPGNKLEIRVNVRATYDMKLAAAPVILSIPMPENTSGVKIQPSAGRGKYVANQNAVVWKISNFPGKSQADIVVVATCLAATHKSSPATKLSLPIKAEFNIPMFSASGLALRYLKVVEKSGYIPEKWLRYVTRAGKYEVRMV